MSMPAAPWLQVMALLAYLMEHKNNYGPHLIIVPNAVMVNWKSELNQWLPSVRCVYYVGQKDERARKFTQEVSSLQFNVLVTTYEYIMRDRAKLSKVNLGLLWHLCCCCLGNMVVFTRIIMLQDCCVVVAGQPVPWPCQMHKPCITNAIYRFLPYMMPKDHAASCGAGVCSLHCASGYSETFALDKTR